MPRTDAARIRIPGSAAELAAMSGGLTTAGGGPSGVPNAARPGAPMANGPGGTGGTGTGAGTDAGTDAGSGAGSGAVGGACGPAGRSNPVVIRLAHRNAWHSGGGCVHQGRLPSGRTLPARHYRLHNDVQDQLNDLLNILGLDVVVLALAVRVGELAEFGLLGVTEAERDENRVLPHADARVLVIRQRRTECVEPIAVRWLAVGKEEGARPEDLVTPRPQCGR